MKNIIIKVPRTGASVEFILRESASTGEVVVVASDDVEIRLKDSLPAAATRPKPLPVTNGGKTTSPKLKTDDLDAILKRLRKLKPTKRATALNCIKSMFQFDAPINDEVANKILEDLRKRGSLTIDAKDKILFRNA